MNNPITTPTHTMTIAFLKEFIANIPDDTEVMITEENGHGPEVVAASDLHYSFSKNFQDSETLIQRLVIS